MSPNWNRIHLCTSSSRAICAASSEPVPMRVNTNLRMMSEEAMRELRKLDHRASGAPQYVFVRRDGLPLHPSLQATGHHYFEWRIGG